MPKLSVIMPTNRTGGLDIVCSSLEKQGFRDFELIVSDCLYKYRKNIVAEKSKQYSFRIKHVEPFSNIFPISAFCHTANTAITYASGEIVLMITDYTWLPPNCLQIHNDFHEQNKNTMLLCPHQYTTLPQLNKNCKLYNNENIKQYINDLNYGLCDDIMWSIFDNDFNGDASTLSIDPITGWADPKLGADEKKHNFGLYNSICMYFNGKNESMPLQPLLNANGWDESMDGTHCYQDTELSMRLEHKGLKFDLMPRNVVYIINPRHIFPFPVRLTDPENNRGILFDNQRNAYPIPNNWSLSQKHKFKSSE